MKFNITIQATETRNFKFGNGFKKTEAQVSEAAIKALEFDIHMSPDNKDKAIRSIQKMDDMFIYSETWTFQRTVEADSEKDALELANSKIHSTRKVIDVAAI